MKNPIYNLYLAKWLQNLLLLPKIYNVPFEQTLLE